MSHIKNVNNCQGNITRPDSMWLIIISGIELHYLKYDTHVFCGSKNYAKWHKCK